MHCVMFPIVASVYLVSYQEDIDEFCATIEIEVPQNVSHVQLQLEKFAHPRTRGTSSIQSPDRCLSGSWVAASRVSSSAIRSRGGASRGASSQINWLSHCAPERGSHGANA